MLAASQPLVPGWVALHSTTQQPNCDSYFLSILAEGLILSLSLSLLH
jgi:hypothetical protein